jgi:GAF domain-containing protein
MASTFVPGADGVGVTLILTGTDGPKPILRTAAYSDPWVKVVDLVQYRTGQGPCIEAIVRCEVTNLPTLEDSSYPDFCALASKEGLGSVLAAPLEIEAKAVGALNLYSRSAHAFGPRSQDVASNFATQAAIALVNIELYEGARALSLQLGDAMESRAVIEQAKGILMGRDGCSADEAFTRLKLMSQETNIKLHDVAESLVANGAGTN